MNELSFEEQHAKLKQDSQPVIAALSKIGIDVDTIFDLVKFSPLDDKTCDVLLKCLELELDEVVAYEILDRLKNPKKRYDGSALKRLFERTKSQILRNRVGTTIAEAKPVGITDWLLDAAREQKYGESRFSLADAIAKLAPHEEANEILMELFDGDPYYVSIALGISGGSKELEFLEGKMGSLKNPAKSEALKSVKRIKKRLRIT